MRRMFCLLLVVSLLVGSVQIAVAKTWVVPHVLESAGGIMITPDTYDTQLFMTYFAGVAGSSGGGGATVDVYLFDETTGQPMTALGGATVCNPCSFPMGDGSPGQPRKRAISLHDQIIAAGGFPDPAMQGYLIADVNGDPDNVTFTTAITDVRSGPSDLAVFVFEPQPIAAAASATSSGTAGSMVVAPHFAETPGIGGGNFDSELFLVYSSGQGGLPAGNGADVDLYLFDQTTDLPLQSGTMNDVCNPCTFAMGTGDDTSIKPRKRKISIESLILNAGGFAAGAAVGSAVMVMRGDDPGGVTTESILITYEPGTTSPLVAVFEPQPIAALATVAVQDNRMGHLTAFRGRPNPSTGGMDLVFSLTQGSNVAIDVFDAQGRKVAAVPLGRLEAGDHSVRWDGRDAAGKPVAAGTYFGRLSASDGSRVTRLIVLQ